MNRRLENLPSASEGYVRTDDFRELLEKTLRQVADERGDEKRRIYRDFIAGAVLAPRESPEEKLGFLRIIEELEPVHIAALRLFEYAAGLQRKGFNQLFRFGGALHEDELARGLECSVEDARSIAGVLVGRGMVSAVVVRTLTPAWTITTRGRKLLSYFGT